MPSIRLTLASLVLGLASANSAFATLQYRVVDLGATLAGNSNAFDINNRGQVVGYEIHDNTLRPVLFSNGVPTVLEGFGSGYNLAYGINDAGVIAGSGYADDDARQAAWVYERGTFRDIGSLYGGDTAANGINNAGTVVGGTRLPNGNITAFSYANGEMRSLGTLGGGLSFAASVNSHGHIVGNSQVASGQMHAFYYDGESMRDLLPQASFAQATDINDRGAVTGITGPAAGVSPRGFLWDRGETRYFDPLEGTNMGYALDLNNRGQVVGSSYESSDGASSRAWLYSDGKLVDLNAVHLIGSPFSQLAVAQAINEAGQIAGYGFVGDKEHAFLLTPVPEPETYALMLAGLFVIGCALARQHIRG